ncbi:RNA polymerase subunit sigma-70 [Candidatus Marinamargulisbacteria bacterium SCGC AG-333-B06]|nr:RNA polymerase subunit sigma-70 [Candidatus Marinamargulisbacteria bacterium SCGC AG-333-B06]
MTPTQTNDTQWATLMKQSQQGDKNAYESLLEDITSVIKKFINKQIFIQDDCEDLVQTILIAIHESRQSFNTDQSFSKWMFAIARYKLADYYAREKKKTRIQETIDFETIKQEQADNGDSQDILNQLLSSLSNQEKEIIIFSKIYGYSLNHIANILNKSESSIKVIIHRSIKKLQKKALHKLPLHYATYSILNDIIWAVIIKGYINGQN